MQASLDSAKVKEIFMRFLGPMGITIFDTTELTTDSIIAQIDSLKNDGILKPDDAEKFKEEIRSLLS